jgi:hypothetical protein
MNTDCAECWKPSAAFQDISGARSSSRRTIQRNAPPSCASIRMNTSVRGSSRDVQKPLVKRVKELVQKVDMHEIMVGIDSRSCRKSGGLNHGSSSSLPCPPLPTEFGHPNRSQPLFEYRSPHEQSMDTRSSEGDNSCRRSRFSQHASVHKTDQTMAV